MKIAKFIAVLFFTFSVACASNESGGFYASNTNSSADSAKPARVGGGGGGGKSEEKVISDQPLVQQVSFEQTDKNQTQPAVTERKIIRNADLQLEADKPEESQQKITAIAESKGGFVVESTQSSSDVRATTRDTVTMTVRVPSAKFNEALDEIRQTANRVIVETVKGEDVTQEFIDIEARLKAKKALEEQFLEIMKRANSVADALNVQRQLAEVRGEIEQIEGRKRFLENQASLSTITIRLQTPTAFSTNSTGFFYRFGESIGEGVDAALNFVLGFVTLLIAVLPFLVLVVLPSGLIIRYFWKKHRRQRSASEIAKEEIKDE